MKKWQILNNKSKIKSKKFNTDSLINILLANRGIKTKKQREDFLNPDMSLVTPKNVGIDIPSLKKSIKRIRKAIDKKEKIIVFGDYDVDGITGTAIVWETLNKLSADIMPYIPIRVEEGYGLSKIGINNVLEKFPDTKVIITVDNGIVANQAVEFANEKGIDVIITDHHQPAKSLPDAYATVHTTLVCGAAVAYILSQEISNKNSNLELVALATVADLVPLKGYNRILLSVGLEKLRNTTRPGLLELFSEASIKKDEIDVYEIGHVIAPRINATGRIGDAMDSLRLICTKDSKKAKLLAENLGLTNRERQKITLETVVHAKSLITDKSKKLLFISHEDYQQGIIGLVAGRLTEEFYRPSIVLSIGKDYSKASARSIPGFNIIEFIRESNDFLVDAGGHPMAAGFTIETKNLLLLQKKLEQLAEEQLAGKNLTKTLRVDCYLDFENLNHELFAEIQKLKPFGMGNPEPTFISENIEIEDMRLVGMDQKHLKVQLSSQTRSDLHLASDQGRTLKIGGIMFAYDPSLKLKIGDTVDIVYTISNNTWNGNNRLEVKIKDIRKSKLVKAKQK
ncbi:MAG: single-stranded-DNA-specific exonuclease RecJ [Candidatus Levybacteria bacterium]|nr:single-stranded-DNA-specific exonuclease RecJ [Candidatus Levybacteria bacterium]